MARRAMRSDWGSVQEIEKGKRYRLRWWQETPDGYRRCSETVRGTRRDACDRLAEIRLEHSRDAPCPTVGELWERYALPRMEAMERAGRLSPKTMAQRRSTWRAHVAPRWADVPADQVAPLDVQRWLDGMTQKPAADARALLRAALAQGVILQVVGSNVASLDYTMPTRHDSRGSAAYGIGDLAGMLARVRGSCAEVPFVLAAFAGCRTGECLAVRRDEVRAVGTAGGVAAVMEVRRQVTSSGVVSERLKNRFSRRCVVVPAPMSALVLAAAGAGGDDPWLTGTGLGEPLGQYAFRHALRARCGADVEPRALRRSWETFAHWSLGLDQGMIEKLMGHVPLGVTGRHYDRPDPGQLASAVAAAWESWAAGNRAAWDELGRACR